MKINLPADPNDPLRIQIENIRRLDLQDIGAVSFFRKVTEGDVTTIEVNFRPDGSFKICYHKDGRILEFRGNHISTHITKDGIVTLQPFREENTPDSK